MQPATSRTRFGYLTVAFTALMALTISLIFPTSATASPEDDNWPRIAGADRYETSLLVAKTAYPQANKVYLVSGQNWPDALSAASFNDGPILLVPPNDPGKAQQMVATLGTPAVTIIGGPGALPTNYDNAFPGAKRIAGADRYETSLLVAKTAYPNPDKVHAVPGWNWPDALSAASFNDGPILLIPYGKTQNQIEDQIHAHLGPAPKYVTLIGALQSVWNKHHKYGYDGEPLGREDRYGTSFSISMYAQEIGAHYQHFLVSGTNWPDGLSAASFPNGIIHLVQPGQPEKWRNWYQLEPTNSTIIGGPGALPTTSTAPQPQPQAQPATPGTGNNQNLGDCEAGPNYPNGRYWKEGWPTTYYDEQDHQTIKLCYNDATLADYHNVRSIEDEHARLLNEHRISLGLPPLRRDPELDAFARKNCERVGTIDNLGHDRAFMLTELGRRVGENATGDESGGFRYLVGAAVVTKPGNPAVTTLQSLLDSPDHRANIERSSYGSFGVGAKVYPDSQGHPIIILFEEFE